MYAELARKRAEERRRRKRPLLILRTSGSDEQFEDARAALEEVRAIHGVRSLLLSGGIELVDVVNR